MTVSRDLAILDHGGSAAISRQPPKQAKRPPRAGTPRVASSSSPGIRNAAQVRWPLDLQQKMPEVQRR